MSQAVDVDQTGTPPGGDHVHRCEAEDCEKWRYSWLALQFHQLREHGPLGDSTEAPGGER